MIISESLFKEGVVKGTLDKYYDKKSAVLMCEPTSRFTNMRLENVVSRWGTEVGKDYNYWGCLGIPFKIAKRISPKNRRKCSGHTAFGYSLNKNLFWGKDPYEVSPNDVLRFVVYCKGYFDCDMLNDKKDYRKGTIGIVIDDYTLNFTEILIEAFTGDGMHTFNVWGEE